ncbi:hypothetical protein NQZ68_007497 [Dissostichus eleginoides]|nr:hypothetical protein NQZ68_007497 [Dissostichus eleginoides]
MTAFLRAASRLFAVDVADSFFDGWDVTKKKDKTKGRHDSLLSHDRHRVKLHSLLADPSSDYVNANYIDLTGVTQSDTIITRLLRDGAFTVR